MAIPVEKHVSALIIKQLLVYNRPMSKSSRREFQKPGRSILEMAMDAAKVLSLMYDCAHALRSRNELNPQKLTTLTAIGESLRDKLKPPDAAILLNISDLMAQLGPNCVENFPLPETPATVQPPDKTHMLHVATTIVTKLKPTPVVLFALNQQRQKITKIANSWRGDDIIKMTAAIEQDGAEAVLVRLQKQSADKIE